MDENITDGVFEGTGPFAIPLLEKFVGATLPNHLDFALFQFEFEDGAIVHIPISSQTAVMLVEALALYQQKLVEREAKGQTKH